MKHLHLSLVYVFALFPQLLFAGPTYGPAVKYSYGPNGNRIKREYLTNTIIAPKPGSTDPSDTLTAKATGQGDNSTVRAYPNPVTTRLTVENLTWKDGNKAAIRLLDITGKDLSDVQTELAKNTISFIGLVPGTYQVHYYLNGKLLTVWKIIKL